MHHLGRNALGRLSVTRSLMSPSTKTNIRTMIETLIKSTREDFDAIFVILDRACAMMPSLDRSTTEMDIEYCHTCGNPLDLARMAVGGDYDLMHDVIGIANHIDRDTGKLADCFLPRFSV